MPGLIANRKFSRIVSRMFNRLRGQPDSYYKKCGSISTVSVSGANFCARFDYKFGRTLGAGTYGIVRAAEGPGGKVAVKIILKQTVEGLDEYVRNELLVLQRLNHPHIVKFVDWFESKVRWNI